jgi:putative ABC transport system permease protein
VDRSYRLGRRLDGEIDDELAFHMEMRAREYEARGESASSAREMAMARFGSAERVREQCETIAKRRQRKMSRAEYFEEFGQDLRFAVRTLSRKPWFTLVAVLTLALGTGANAAIFSVVDPLVVRALPYPAADRLVAVWAERNVLSRAEYAAVRERVTSLEAAEAYQAGVGFTLGTDDSTPAARVHGARVTPGLFALLGARPELGRWFLSEESEPGRGDVVILSHGLWQERFGADEGVVGRKVVVDGVPRTVVGVMPPDFSFPSPRDRIWVPVTIDLAAAGDAWGYSLLRTTGRLRPGATVAGVQAELRGVAAELRFENPLWTPPDGYGADATVVPLREHLVGDLRLPLLVLLAAVAAVLLIACVNVANLLMARGAARSREFAVRVALGASRGRIVRQLLTESLLLAALGSAVGLLMAVLGTPAIVAALPADTPRLHEVALDGRVLAFTVVLTFGTALVFGLLPALRAARAAAPGGGGALGHAAAGAGRIQRRLAGALVVGEIALAVLLVTSAGLLIRSFQRLTSVDPGFRTEAVLTARITPPPAGFDEDARRRALHGQILERVAAMGGVRSAALTSQLPFDQDPGGTALFIRDVTQDPNDLPMFEQRAVTPEFFQVLGIPLLRGRAFHSGDAAGAPLVAMIDETAAREFFPDSDPVGATVGFPWSGKWLTVVGVVGGVRNRELGASPRPALYRPFDQSPHTAMKLVARTAGPVELSAPALRRIVADVDPAVAVSDVRSMDRWIADSLARPRFATALLLAFAALALALGAVGIYGVMSFATAQRVREFGVRKALGARAADLARLTLRDAGLLAVTGIAIGVGGAWGASRLLGALLYETSTTEPAVFLAAPLLLLLVAVTAALGPALRAARVDPVQALKQE